MPVSQIILCSVERTERGALQPSKQSFVALSGDVSEGPEAGIRLGKLWQRV
jgi:hypothetical protein